MLFEKDLAEGVHLSIGDGKIKLEADYAAVVIPALENLKAKVVSGEIDLVKGTDIDKMIALKVLELVIEQAKK